MCETKNMNATFDRMIAHTNQMHDSVDDEEEKRYSALAEACEERIANIGSQDIISVENGLRFIRRVLERNHPDAKQKALRMAKKLLLDVSKKRTTTCLLRKSRNSKPVGRPPKGKVWDYDKEMWKPPMDSPPSRIISHHEAVEPTVDQYHTPSFSSTADATQVMHNVTEI